MRNISKTLVALIMMTATPAFFTSCQEDAPAIDYKLNVTVNNDFTEVVKAINNGTVKMTEAVGKLTEALDALKASQQEKLKMIADVITSQTNSMEAKLAAVEAAMKAQTLSLETKLGAIELATKAHTVSMEGKLAAIETAIKAMPDYSNKLAAIEAAMKAQTLSLETKLAALELAMKAQTQSLEGKLEALKTTVAALPDYTAKLAAIEVAITALPDYTAKLTAIEAAITALPDYTAKFTAIETALNNIKTEVNTNGTVQGDIKTALNNMVTEVTNLTTQVQNGHANAKTALEKIVDKLEELKKKMGSGSTTPAPNTIAAATSKPVGSTITLTFDAADVPVVEGATETSSVVSGGKVTKTYTTTSQNLVLKGTITKLNMANSGLKTLDLSQFAALTELNCEGNELTSLKVAGTAPLTGMTIHNNKLNGAAMDAFISSLPTVTGSPVLFVKNGVSDLNKMSAAQVAAAAAKGWDVQWDNGSGQVPYLGE